MEKNGSTIRRRRSSHQVRNLTGVGLVKRFLAEENGPTAAEYAILLALLILGAMATIGNIGSSMQTIYSMIATSVDAAFASSS
jgi:pilus assembly protein Flp/PilA